jgi:integrase
VTTCESEIPLIFNGLWGFLIALEIRINYSAPEKVAEKWPKFMKPSITTEKPKKVRTASKTTAAYWSGKIRLERKPGWESSHYFVRIQAHGQRRKMKLNSTIREEAAREAAGTYLEILSKGWPKDEGSVVFASESSDLPENPTIEDWFNVAKSKNLVAEASIKKYFEALQTIVGEILGTPRARKTEQRAKIKSFPVSALTRTNLELWLEKRLIAASKKPDLVASRRARSTTRSLAINAKSLFSENVLKGMRITADEMNYVPFSKLKLPAKGQERYTSRFDAKRLLATAARELGGNSESETDVDGSKFEQWKILYLALVAGLRYKEIDQLRKHDIMINARRISISTHETFAPKNDASVGDVPVTAAAAKVLDGMMKRTKGTWFIKDGPSTASKYRAATHHDAIVSWLRNYEERGIKPLAKINKPLHELRKEAGSLVNRDHGLVSAQQFLRHRSINTTAGVYVDASEDVNTGLA